MMYLGWNPLVNGGECGKSNGRFSLGLTGVGRGHRHSTPLRLTPTNSDHLRPFVTVIQATQRRTQEGSHRGGGSSRNKVIQGAHEVKLPLPSGASSLMKMRSLLLILAAVPLFAADTPPPFDWPKAREIFQRSQNGGLLTPDEQKILDEARRRVAAGENPNGPGSSPIAPTGNAAPQTINGQPVDWDRARTLLQRQKNGETLSPEDQKYLDEAKRIHDQGGGPGGQTQNQQPPPPPPQNLIPLTELTGKYQDQDGGLYGGGKNDPPPELAARAKQAAAQIHPLNAEGKPAADGKIVLVSLGMSNTTMEFGVFKRNADVDARKADNLVIVDCAQGSKTAMVWATQDQPWDVALTRIQKAGVTPAQVQVMWLKEANAGPTTGWPAATDQLRDDVRTDIKRAREKYPNLKLVFLSSRIYGGCAKTRLNPEPYAYEGAFAMRAVIRDQPADGPVLLWGPYLWTNGEKGRALDGLKWLPEDCTEKDGTHPSPKGEEKVAKLLLDFFTTNVNARPWFTKPLQANVK